MFIKKVLQSVLVGLISLAIFSCTMGGESAKDGTLVVNVNEDLGRSIIQPTIEMVIDTYELTLTKGATTVTATIDDSVTSKVFTNLEPGEWTIEAAAKNTEGTIIAEGDTTATVAVAETVAASIIVTPLTGDGTLELNINWPVSLIDTPVVSASLIDSDSTSNILEFTLTPEGAVTSGAYSGDWTAGYYTLFLKLLDDDYVLWSRTVTVRMIEGETATATYTLTESDLSNVANPEVYGAIELSIGADLQNPFNLTLSGEDVTLQRDESMTLTVSDQPADSTISWYINGTKQDAYTSDTLTIVGEESVDTGLELTFGRYWVDVIVTSDGISNSKTTFVDIPEYMVGDSAPAGGMVFYDKGKVTDGWRYLEAWTEDDTTTYLWSTVSVLTSATGEIGDGYYNTYTLLDGDEYPAAKVIRDATYGGRGDWFLPSIKELEELLLASKTIALNISGTYWSSSEYDIDEAYRSFLNGSVTQSTDYYKHAVEHKVRAVRRF